MKQVLMVLWVMTVLANAVHSQEKLKIGEIRNGKLVVTQQETLKKFLLSRIDNSGTLSKELKVSYAPEGNRLLAYYHVTGNMDHVTNIGVLLVIIRNEAFIQEGTPESTPGGPGAGGSYEVQCFGSCPTCQPNISWGGGGWLPLVYCECTGGESGNCSMITKVIISIKIGL